MSRPVVALAAGMPAADALKRMRKEGFRHAPVIDEGRMVGIVTERDLLRVLPGTVGQLDAARKSPQHLLVSAAMTADPITVSPVDHLEDAATLLVEHKINGLPVVWHGRLVGMVTATDLLRAFSQIIASGGGQRVALSLPPDTSDSEEETAVQAEDLVAIGVSLGLRVSTVLSRREESGALMTTFWIDGSPEDRRRFLVEATSAGYLLLEREEYDERDSA